MSSSVYYFKLFLIVISGICLVLTMMRLGKRNSIENPPLKHYVLKTLGGVLLFCAITTGFMFVFSNVYYKHDTHTYETLYMIASIYIYIAQAAYLFCFRKSNSTWWKKVLKVLYVYLLYLIFFFIVYDNTYIIGFLILLLLLFICWSKKRSEKDNTTNTIIIREEQDMKKCSLNILRELAKVGNKDAQFLLGLRYAKNNWILASHNADRAAYWYLKAAEQGHPMAQYKIYLCYIKGKGVNKNIEKGLYWLIKSANNNMAISLLSLGDYYVTGVTINNQIIIIKDIEKAKECWRKALELGNEDAKNRLEKIYD